MTDKPTPTKIATLRGVREHNEHDDVELWLNADGRIVVRSYNECGNNYTDLDLRDLLDWLDSGSNTLAETENARHSVRPHITVGK